MVPGTLCASTALGQIEPTEIGRRTGYPWPIWDIRQLGMNVSFHPLELALELGDDAGGIRLRLD